MAIYAGNWTDTDGLPFTPGAYASGIVDHGPRAMALRPKPIGFTAAKLQPMYVRRLSHHWRYILTQAQRDAWNGLYSFGIINRTNSGPPLVNGFLHFLAVASERYWQLHDTDQLWLGIPAEDTSDLTITAASASAQTISWSFEYGPLLGSSDYHAVSLYQIQPGKHPCHSYQYYTRLLDRITLIPPGPATMTGTSAARWPLTIHHPAVIYLRPHGDWDQRTPDTAYKDVDP